MKIIIKNILLKKTQYFLFFLYKINETTIKLVNFIIFIYNKITIKLIIK